MDKLRIVGWTSFDDDYPMTLDDSELFNEKLHLVAQEIGKNGYFFSGEEHQNSLTGMPVFSDGTAFRASMRTWGYIMASVNSSKTQQYNYMDFYMSSCCESKLPEYKEIKVKPSLVKEESVGCTTVEDRQIVAEAMSYGFPFMTTDKVLKKYYEKKLNE